MTRLLDFLSGQDIISISDFTRPQIEAILKISDAIRSKQTSYTFAHQVMASCFFEPSTRTKFSFEAAICKFGGQAIGFSSVETTSIKKGESLMDTIKVLGAYADVIVIRHPESGSAKIAAEATTTPVINAGDGVNQHPTQSLIDLYTIHQCQGRLDDLHVGIIGDLKYGRAVHSLIEGCSLFNIHLHFIELNDLKLSTEKRQMLDKRNVQYSTHADVKDILESLDILYVTRIQKERFNNEQAYQQYQANQQIDRALLTRYARSNLKILHPLPRVDEIHTDVDNSEFAYYFEQAANGVPIRQALLAGVLGIA